MTISSGVQQVHSDELSNSERASLRKLFAQAWSVGETFTDDDWTHATGGMHFIATEEGEIISHASVVERVLHAGEHILGTGYVEAVATHPSRRRQGFASALLHAAGNYIDANFSLGALSTGEQEFYARFGWQPWRGPTGVRTERGIMRTAEEDGLVMVRLTPATPDIDLSEPISCDWRAGDPW